MKKSDLVLFVWERIKCCNTFVRLAYILLSIDFEALIDKKRGPTVAVVPAMKMKPLAETKCPKAAQRRQANRACLIEYTHLVSNAREIW